MPSLAVETRAILRVHGIRPRKALGQNFLIDREALDSVVRAVGLAPDDLVLEIGPGIGTLTAALAATGADVVAIELDGELAKAAALRMAAQANVRVVPGNALHLDLSPWLPAGRPYKLAANIPYYITAPILRHFLTGSRQPTVIVLTVQREVAERLAAPPGRLSLLGISAQFYARVEIVRIVPASSFYPQPRVDSAIVRLTPYDRQPIEVDDDDRFFRLVKAGFGAKRKQLHNALVQGMAHIPAPRIEQALAESGIDRTRRAETLSLMEWGALYRNIRGQHLALLAAGSADPT